MKSTGLPSIHDLEPGEWKCVETDYLAGTSVLEHPTFGKAKVQGAFWAGGVFDTRSPERHGVMSLRLEDGAEVSLHHNEAKTMLHTILRDGVMLGFKGDYELRMSLVRKGTKETER